MAVIGGGGAGALEEGAALRGARRDSPAQMRRYPSRSVRRDGSMIGAKALELRIDHRIGPIGGDHAALPAADAGSHRVRLRSSSGAFGGGEHLDVEALEQRARAELRLGEAFADAVEIDDRRSRRSSRTSMPNSSRSAWSSHSRDGVPRNR